MANKILIIDDDEWISLLVKKYLDFEKYDVTAVQQFDTRDDILSQVTGTSFDCVLVDYMLVCCTGIDLTRKLKETEECAKSSFVLLTSMTLTTDLSRDILELHMRYLKKPFSKEDLLQTIYEATSGEQKGFTDIL
ncbi:MAG: response regulator transcription factor [Fibrobacteria bacterium]|nr:response regulator transcription factor [Fibrobacteria bacterium]